jgi:hypothetical protein
MDFPRESSPSPSPSPSPPPPLQHQHYHTWALPQAPVIPPSPSPVPATPVPATPVPTRGSKRPRGAKLTPDEHLILMGHVCEHRGEYTKGKIAFWKTISQLFEEDTGNIRLLSLLLYLFYTNLYTNLYINYRPLFKRASIDSK